jgi:uncharacterized repeat protein (TIGR03803 family)
MTFRQLVPGGVLYGTANGGGDNGAGLVFELDPPAVPGDPWTENILHAFTGGTDGGSPGDGSFVTLHKALAVGS